MSKSMTMVGSLAQKAVMAFLVSVGLLSVPVATLAEATTFEVGPGKEFATIQAAVNAAGTGATVLVYPNTYSERVDVNKSISIIGSAGAATTIVDGGAGGSVFFVDGDFTVLFKGLTIRNGGNTSFGGGVYAAGDVTGCHIVFDSCVVSNNTATTEGGGIYCVFGSSVDILNTTISGNSTVTSGTRYGGGVHLNAIDLVMTNSTVSGNTARHGGGLYLTASDAIITHSTFTLNSASNAGGGINVPAGSTLTLNNSIVAGNNVAGNTAHATANTTVTPAGSNNRIEADPKLAALADNGGPTPTHALLADSLALNFGAAGLATTDQRGVPRAQGNAPDAGAFEAVYIAYVDENYTASACDSHVWHQDAFATVQEAVSAIAAGGTVNVAAGTYAGDVTLGKQLTLTGTGAPEITGNVTFDAKPLAVSGVGLAAGKSWNVTANAVIQQAVTAANAGETVNVAAGTYNESVTVDEAITLLGATGSTINSTGTALTIGSNGVTAKGFALAGVIGVSATGVGGLTIENNTITAGAVGMQLQGLDTATGGVLAKNNTVTLLTQLAGSNPTAAVMVLGAMGATAVTLENNVISGAYTGYVLYGVNTESATTVVGGTVTGVMQGISVINQAGPAAFAPSLFVVDGVMMSGFAGNYPALPNSNFHAGVYVFSGGSAPAAKITGEIKNVNVSGTGNPQQDTAGLYFGDFSTGAGVRQAITVSSCIVSGNKNRGINVRGPNAEVDVGSSMITNNGFDPFHTGGNDGIGVSVANGAKVNLHDSTVRNPAIVPSGYAVRALYQFLQDGTAIPALTVRKCVIENNDCPSGKLAAAQSGTLDAIHNWWGAASGPAAGLVTTGVTYTPWYSEAECSNLVPYGLALDNSSVPENFSGALVGTFSTTDADGVTYAYALVAGAGDTDNASFTIDGSTLKTAVALNFEAKSNYSVRAQTSDGHGVYEQIFTITATDVNDAPVLNDIDNTSIPELIPFTFTATASDQDLPRQTLTFSLTGTVPEGATITPGGVFSWSPTEAQSGVGTYKLTVMVSDGTLLTDSQEFRLTVDEVNVAPVTGNDAYSVIKNGTLTIAAPGVRSNDSDVDLPANSLSAVLVAGPAHGSLTAFNADGSFTYVNSGDGSATDSFTYQVNDGTADSNVATVNITVKPVWNTTQNTFSDTIQAAINAATAGDSISVAAGTYPEQLTIAKALTVTGSDGAALEGTTLGLQKVGVKIKSGDVTFNNIDVSHFSGNGIIVGYETSIPGSLKNIHITNCKISGIQPGYSHGFGIYVGYESEAFKYVPPKLTAHLDYSGLLIENNEISDSKSSALVLQSITGTPGTLVVRNNYIHDGNNDGIWLDCARNIVVEDNDLVRNVDGIYISSYADTVQTPKTPALNGPYSPMNIQITGNQILDSKVYGGIYFEAGWPSTIVMSQNSIAGNTSGGLLNYLSEEVDASFNYWGDASGPAGAGDDVVGLVNYTPFYTEATFVNLAPYDIGLSGATVVENMDAGTVVGNVSTVDADVSDTVFLYTLLSGTEFFQLDGTTLKTKVALNHESTPTITVRVRTSDQRGGLCEKDFNVTVTDVNEAPVLSVIEPQGIGEQATLSFSVTATDQDAGASLSFSLDGETYGASITADGAFSWETTEAQGRVAPYSLTVRVTDGELTDTKTFDVTVAEVNVAPVLTAIPNWTSDGLTPVELQASASDQDAPVQHLTYSLVEPAFGASITADGALSWQPTEEQDPGDYTFTVKVTDDGSEPGLSDQKTFSVTVTEDNKAPVANPESYTVAENGTMTIADAEGVLTNDRDADIPANHLSAVLVGGPAHATTFALNADGSFTYVNNGDEEASDSFTYKVNDGTVDSNEATVSITITTVNDAPTVVPAKKLPNLDKQQDFVTFTIPLAEVFADAENDALDYSVAVAGSVIGASVEDTTLTVTAVASARGVATVTVTATERSTAEKLSVNDIFTVTVKPVKNVTQTTFFDTIQAAIDAATSGDTISVAAGTYTEVGQIVIDKDVTIMGAGNELTTIKPDMDFVAKYDGWIRVNAGVDLLLSNVKLDGAGHLVYNGVYFLGDGVIDGCWFANIQLEASGPAYEGTAVLVTNSCSVDITNCKFTDIGRNGIRHRGFGNVQGNTYTGKGNGNWLDYFILAEYGSDITVDNNVVSNCTGVALSDSSTSCAIAIWDDPDTTANITDNELENNTLGIGIVGINSDDPAYAWPNVTIGDGNVILGGEYGIAFYVYPGCSYTPTVSFGVTTLKGQSIAALWIDDSIGAGVSYDISALIFLDASNNVITDNFAKENLVHHALDASGSGLFIWNAKNVYVTQASGSIQRAIAAATAGDTINVAAGTYVEIGQILIAKNLSIVGVNKATTIIKPAQDIPEANYKLDASAWILVNSGVTFNLSNVTLDGAGKLVCNAILSHGQGIISGNIIKNIEHHQSTHYDGCGIALYGSDMTVSDNSLSGIGREGIFVAFSSTAIITGNTYLGKGAGNWLDYAIEVGRSSTASISGNMISGNTGVAVVDGSTSAGILVTSYYGPGTSSAMIENCTITGNTTGIVVGYDENDNSTVVAHYNDLSGNADAGILSTGSAVAAENNWWGFTTGPTNASNPGGTGSAADGNLDFSPWLGDGSDDPATIGFQPNPSPVYYTPSSLVFTTQPANTALGETLSPPLVVSVMGENNAVATQYTGPVTIAITANPGTGVLDGTLTVDASAGVATFSDLKVLFDGGVGFKLTATVGALTQTSATFDIANPSPVLSGLSPIFKTVNSGAFTLTVNGSGFVRSSKVLWGGAERATTFVNENQLTAAILASDITAAGTVQVTVSSPAAGGGTSGAQTFNITALAVPTVVWVDDNWNGPGACGGHVWGYDAFASIQAGVNAVANNGTVNVLAGTYNEDVTLSKAVNVLGAGAGASIVVGQIGGAGSTFTFGAEGIVLDGFTITRDGNTVAQWNNPNLNIAGVAIQTRSSGTVRNCLVTGMRTGIDINNSSGITVRNNEITFNRTGLIMRNRTDNLTVVENKITDNWTVGVLFLDASGGSNVPVQTAANCSFSDNNISGNWYGDIVDRQTGGSLPAPGTNLKNFSGNWLGTVTPVVSTANSVEPGYSAQIPVAYGGTAVNPGGAPNILGLASANVDFSPWLNVGTDTDVSNGFGTYGFQGVLSTLWVDDNSPQSGTTGRIQEGVNLVTGNGTVNVLAGIYAERVVVNKRLSLLGQDKATTSVDGSGVGVVMTVTASDVVISGFTVRNSGMTAADGGIGLVNVMRCEIANNIVSGNAIAIAALGGGSHSMRDNTVTGNGVGFALDNLASFGGTKEMGSTHCVLSGNTVSGNARMGIYVAESCDFTEVSANTVTGNGESGIYLWKADNCQVTCNESTGNLRSGFELQGSVDNVIEHNTLSGNGEALRVRNDSIACVRNTIRFNDCSGAGAGVIIEFGEYFTGDKDSFMVDVANNWWGSLRGPTQVSNPGGDGCSSTANADFSPWLGDGTDLPPAAIGFQPNLSPVYYTPVSLEFLVQPGSANLDAPLARQPVVQVLDETGHVAVQFNGTVTLAIGTPNPGAPVAGVLNGRAAVTVVNGVAVFDGLNISAGTGVGYTLVASTTGLPTEESTAFTIINREPVLVGSIGNQNVNELETLTFTASASDLDGAAQLLTFTLTGAPDHATINPSTGNFSWTPDENQGAGSYTFNVVVTDNGAPAQSDFETITVTVNEVNVAPVMTGVPSTATIPEMVPYTFTAVATDADNTSQTLTFSLVGAPAGAGIDSDTGVFTWNPAEAQGPQTYTFKVVVSDTVTETEQAVELTVSEVNLAPVLATIPPQSVNKGNVLTFTASATDDDLPANTLTYSMSGSYPAGAMIHPSTGVFTWTATDAAASYSFTVTVSDGTTTVSQLVTISVVTATQDCPGFRSPSDTMVVSNSFAFAETLTDLSWTPVLPDANWTVIAANSGGNGAVEVQGGAVVFTNLPATSPAVFTYTVRVPGNAAVSNSLSAAVSFNGLTVQVAPMAIYRYHSADYRRDLTGSFAGQFRKIDSTEVNRVLSYWRYGYKPSAMGLDGFEAATGHVGTEGRHSADYQGAAWVIDGDERDRVLAYWRTTDSGYHVATNTTPDGYAPNRTGTGPRMAASLPTVTQTGPATYNPGQTVTITCAFSAKLLALGYKPELPAGWVIESVSGDGAPELVRGEIGFVGSLSATPIRLTYTVRVPLTENRTVALGGDARLFLVGSDNPDTYAMEPLAMAPQDSDSNGMADAWERAYAGAAGSLEPAGDLDGDRMSNYAEYLCGTIPADPTSLMQMVAMTVRPDGKAEVSWSSVTGRVYTLQRADGSPAAANFSDIATGIEASSSGSNVYVDSVDTAVPHFYRVILQ